MTYRAPVADIAFTLKHGAGLARTLAKGGDLAADDVDAILEEAGKFATDVIDNSGTPERTRMQIDVVFEDLERTTWTASH